jgi:hypothetical protein
MDVLGHEDVAEDVKLVAASCLFEDGEEGRAGVVVVEVGKPTITTEGDEVVVSEGVESLQIARHRCMVAGVVVEFVEWLRYGWDVHPHPTHRKVRDEWGTPLSGPPAKSAA